MIWTLYCRNVRCRESKAAYESFRFGLCPSCWWMAKTSFAVGSLTVAGVAFVAGMIARWLL